MSLEILILETSVLRLTNPLLVFAALVAVLWAASLLRPWHGDTRRTRQVTVAVSILAIGVYLWAVLWYMLLEQYTDPAEPTVAALAWLFEAGRPLYHAIDSAERYSHIYGPMAFVLPGWCMTLLGPGIVTSKIVGAVSALASIGLVFRVTLATTGLRSALVLTGLFAALCLMFQNYSFWIRPDSVQLTCAAVAVWAVADKRHAIAATLALGIATGVLAGLKMTGPLYALPAFAVLAANRRYAVITSAAVLAVAVAAAPFVMYDNISFSNYLLWLRTSAGNGLVFQTLKQNIGWAFFLLVPLAPPLRRALASTDRWLLVSLAAAMMLVALAAAKPGAGAYHLMPFLPFVMYGTARSIAARPNPREEDRDDRVMAAAFAISIAGIAFLQTSHFIWSATRRAGQDVKYDVTSIVERHPSARIEMGYASADESLTFLRPLLVFRQGAYFVDAPAIQEFQMSGLGLPTATIRAIESCRVDMWLIPKGAEPFSLRNRYPATGYAPLFDAAFRRAFATAYRPIETTRYFDVWACRQ